MIPTSNQFFKYALLPTCIALTMFVTGCSDKSDHKCLDVALITYPKSALYQFVNLVDDQSSFTYSNSVNG